MGTEYIGFMIVSAILGAIAIFCFLTAYRHHKEKGFIFTNRWLFASPKEREQMDEKSKKYEYRVGRNVFAFVGLTFLLLAIYVIVHFSWLLVAVYVITAITIIYGFILLARWVKNSMSSRY